MSATKPQHTPGPWHWEIVQLRKEKTALAEALQAMLCWLGAIPPSISKVSPPTEAEAIAKARAALAAAGLNGGGK